MLVGYARTSTTDQTASLEDQVRTLTHTRCEKVFVEQASGASQREVLTEALRFLREGDTLVVMKMDRLARDLRTLLSIVDDLDSREIALRILDFGGEPLQTRTASGRLTLQMFGAFAEFERTMMLERQRVGIEKAKAAGRYTGRKPTAMNQKDTIKALSDQGETRAAIATRLGISERSVYRALAGT